MKKIFGIRYFSNILNVRGELRLHSLVSDYVWDSPLGFNETPPVDLEEDVNVVWYGGVPYDEAGFHAYRDYSKYEDESLDAAEFGSITAVVRGFGTTHVHEKVFRSQGMQIEGIIHPTECSMAATHHCSDDLCFVPYPAEPHGYELVPACRSHADMIYGGGGGIVWGVKDVMSTLARRYGVNVFSSPEDSIEYLANNYSYKLGES